MHLAAECASRPAAGRMLGAEADTSLASGDTLDGGGAHFVPPSQRHRRRVARDNGIAPGPRHTLASSGEGLAH